MSGGKQSRRGLEREKQFMAVIQDQRSQQLGNRDDERSLTSDGRTSKTEPFIARIHGIVTGLLESYWPESN